MIPNPWLILGVVVAVVLAVTGAYFYGVNNGEKSERVKWQEREIAALEESNKKIKELTEAYRKKEQENVDKTNRIAAKLEAANKSIRERAAKDAADARSGALGLRFTVADARAVGNCPAEAGPSSPGSTNPKAVELPREITGSLFRIVNEADEVADQLRACQEIIVSDRQ